MEENTGTTPTISIHGFGRLAPSGAVKRMRRPIALPPGATIGEGLIDDDGGRRRVRVGGREPAPRENPHVEYVEQVRRDAIHA